MFYAYTDGVTEAKNNQDELFSEQQLLDKVDPNIDCPQAFIDDVLQHIDRHRDGADQFDDITMLAVGCCGAMPPVK